MTNRPWWVDNYISMDAIQIRHEILRLNEAAAKVHIPDRLERLAYLATELFLKLRLVA